MSMTKRYWGSFKDINDNVYRAEIWQEGTYEASEIFFSSDPIVIEWKEEDKLTPIRESKATIRIESKSDRQFIDLYTTSIKSVRLEVYRNNNLYWSGTIDTELYEEPYSYSDGYVVSITFSDFSILKRQKFDMTGFKTINEILNRCIQSTGIVYASVIKNIATKLNSSDSEDIFDNVSLTSDNFYDEDGEADTLYDALEYVLRPFSAFIIQKNGLIRIQDLHTMACEENLSLIKWKGTDAMLSVDKVYNNAKITFSAYEKPEVMEAKITDGELSEPSESEGLLIKTDNDMETVAQGFRIRFVESVNNESFEIKNGSGAKFFAIKSIYSGNDERGIAYCCKPQMTSYLMNAASCMRNGVHYKGELFKCIKRAYVGYTSFRRADYRIKISLDFMFDVRYNPFEQAALPNEEGNWKRLQDWCNFAYVPIVITLRDSNGVALKHYNNKDIVMGSSFKSSGSWLDGEASWGEAYLCYYDNANRKSASGLGGWCTNRQTIGYYRGSLPAIITKRGDGEYIEMPPVSGWLDVRIGEGIYQFDYKREEKDIYSRTRWVMYKSLSIEIVDKYGKDLNPKDQVINAWIDKNADEQCKVETHVGTLKNASPAARGILFNTNDKSIINNVYRNGNTDLIEKLLLGTIYSQHGNRKNKLTGTAQIVAEDIVIKEKNIAGIYMLTGEVQNLDKSESEITAVEVSRDNYEGVEFK